MDEISYQQFILQFRNSTSDDIVEFAFETQNLQALRYMCNQNGVDLNHILRRAAANNCQDIVVLALAKGADINDQDIGGRTALLEAVNTKNPILVQYLIDNHAKVNLREDRGEGPLHEACRYPDNLRVVKILVENGKADIWLEDTKGRTPFWIAESHNCWVIRNYFVKQNNINNSIEYDSGSESPDEAVGSPASESLSSNYLYQ